MKKSKLKSILSAVCLIAVVVGTLYGAVKLFSIETKAVSSLSFSVGGLDEENGKYVEREDTIYTKEAIECQGLTVSPEFDSKVKYQVFWYNEDEIYFGCTEVTEQKLVGNIPEYAKYCRIMILPLQIDENGDKITDFKIDFWEVTGYANDLDIKVYKKQEYVPIDYYVEAQRKTADKDYVVTSINDGYEFYEHKYYHSNTSGFVTGMTSYSENHSVVKLSSTDVKSFKFYFNEKDFDHRIVLVYFDAEGIELGTFEFAGTSGSSHIIDVPENAAYMIFNVFDVEKPIIINKYLPR